MIDPDPAGLCILAFDCSGPACSAAVAVGGRVVAERFEAMTRGQAEIMMPQIQAVMTEAAAAFPGLDFARLDLIATTVGPGSFTGLRLGLAAARGLALATGRAILALDAFEAVAAGVPTDRRGNRPLIVAIDSRRGSAFVQRFDAAGNKSGDAASVEPADFAAWAPPGAHLVVGDAAPTLRRAFTVGRTDIEIADTPDLVAARHIARFAACLGMAGVGRLPAMPLYLRAPDVTLPGMPVLPS